MTSRKIARGTLTRSRQSMSSHSIRERGAAIRLFRGVVVPSKTAPLEDVGYTVHFEPRTEPRQSRTGDSKFLRFVSDSELWKSIPNRSLSSLCSVNENMTEVFSDFDSDYSFLVIPYDNVSSFASCPEDFNDVLKDLRKEFQDVTVSQV